MKKGITPRNLPGIVGVCVGLLYLSFPSSFYNFDGVACAIAVELGELRHLLHGNHIAYGVVGDAQNNFWKLFGYTGAAILPLQILDSILGGVGAGLLVSLLLRLRTSKTIAALSGFGLGLSYAYWFWSIEVQVYLLGVSFLIGTAREAFSERPDPVRLALWHAGAMLGHAGHVMFAPVAIYALMSAAGSTRNRRWKPVLTYAGTAALTVLAVYGAAAAFVIRPESLAAVRTWLLGSAALTLDKSFLWHGGYTLDSLFTWSRMTLRIFADPSDLTGGVRILGWLLGAAGLAGALLGFRASRRLTLCCGVWFVSYAVLFISWEPYTIVYRVSDLALFWILIGLGVSQAGRREMVAGMAVFVLALGIFNKTVLIGPKADAARNAPLQEARWLSQVTPENAWLAAIGLDEVYIPYFGHRRTLNLRYFSARPQALKERIRRLQSAGDPVYVTSTTLERLPEYAPKIGAYPMELVGESLGSRLYRLNP